MWKSVAPLESNGSNVVAAVSMYVGAGGRGTSLLATLLRACRRDSNSSFAVQIDRGPP